MARILVVDDDAELKVTVAEVLSGEGFQVTVADDAEAALKLMEEPSFDLVLLDLVMPGMGGMAALPLLKKSSPGTRVVMMTAFSTVDNAVEAMRRGADDYVTKPFKIGELLATVKRNMEEKRFRECHLVLSMDETFSSLSNSIRRRIIHLLHKKSSMRFMDIARSLEIEDHTKVNFHLKVLKDAGLIEQDESKAYLLSDSGRRLADCLATFVNTLKS